jgi:hypothetical protein
MPDDLRETAIRAAAARYGSEHYRGLLFWHSFRRFWPGLLLLALGAACVVVGWRVGPAAGKHLVGLLPFALGALAVVAVTWLLIRRARSPYRRRRF